MMAIFASPSVAKEIEEVVKLREVATKAVRDPDTPGLSPVGEKLLKSLRAISTRRELRAAKSKRSFRREHTI